MPELDLSLLERFSQDRATAMQVLFSHRHPQATPAAHLECVELWRAEDEFIVIEAFREFGKTTLAEEFLLLEAAFGNFPYCLLIGETYDKACERLTAIDYEARTNEKLIRLFGGDLLAKKSIENKVWFKTGALIQALGWEQELQSFKHLARRPTRAYLDDPENLERVRDGKAVDESMRKLFLELIPALDKNDRKLRITQTRRAEDCMITRLAQNSEWLYRAFPICDGEPEDPATKAIWPERYPMEWVRKEQRRYVSAGMLGEFLQAYMLRVVDPQKKPFRDEQLAQQDMSPWHWMPRYAIYDPSRTSRQRRESKESKAQSDRTGKVVVSRLGSKILVHESGGYFWKPDELIGDLFSTREKHSPAKIGIEKNSLDDWLLQPIRIEMLKRGDALPLVALQAPQDRSKEDFILGLQPFALAKDIVLIGGKAAHPQLVAEWSNFPQGPRDVLNALAYSLRMFAGVPVYENFSGANIGEAPTPRQGEDCFVAWNATAGEVTAVAVLRDDRRLFLAWDGVQTGPLQEAVKTLAFGVRTAFPRCTFQHWVPAETFDQAQRVALVPALRANKCLPYRAEHIAVARGSLSQRIAETWRHNRLLMVDRRCREALNALGATYAYGVEKGGRQKQQPEESSSRTLAEGLECMVAALDRADLAADGLPRNANIGHTPQGVAYVSVRPTR